MNIIARIFSYLYSKHMQRLEREIGYSLKFGKIPETWINGWMAFDMGKSWKKWGINADGVNYFTVGSLSGGTSSRFLRNKKQYQSWLGAYLVRFREDKKLTLQDYYDLAVADQKNWLEDFGDDSPFCEMPAKGTGRTEKMKVGEYEAKLYEFLDGHSHSDVGENSGNLRNKIVMGLMASMFNRCNPKLKLRVCSFIPKDFPSNYERVLLRGYVAIVELDKRTKVVLYGNGAAIRDEKGKEIDYSPELKKGILKAFSQARITKA